MLQPLPHDNSYWVEPGRLMAGEYPGNRQPEVARLRLREYLACGVDVFLDLTTPADRLAPYGSLLREEAARQGRQVHHRCFPIPDMGVPESREFLAHILDQIDADLRKGRCVYVHCWGGVGRTGTVIGCHLVRHGRSGDAALERLAELWSTVGKRTRKPRCPETNAQRDFVRAWVEPR